MATKNLTIAVENEVLQALAASVDAEKPNEVTTACEKIAQAALFEWYEWMTGSRRYLSLTEQQIERVAYLYRELLPKERPSATDISYRFKIPDGPASYLSRVLGDRKFTHWRQQGLEELKAAINSRSAAIKQNLQNNEGDKLVVIRLSKMAVRELERCFAEALKTDDSLALPQRRATSGDHVEVAVEWNCLSALSKLEELK